MLALPTLKRLKGKMDKLFQRRELTEVSALTAPQLMKYDILMCYHARYDITQGPERISKNINRKSKTISVESIEKTWDAMVATYRDYMKVNEYEGHSYHIRGFADIVRGTRNLQLIEIGVIFSGHWKGNMNAKVIKGRTVCWQQVDNQDFLEFPDSCFFIEDFLN